MRTCVVFSHEPVIKPNQTNHFFCSADSPYVTDYPREGLRLYSPSAPDCDPPKDEIEVDYGTIAQRMERRKKKDGSGGP